MLTLVLLKHDSHYTLRVSNSVRSVWYSAPSVAGVLHRAYEDYKRLTSMVSELMSYITLVTLILTMYPKLQLVEIHHIADIHVDWHETNGIDENDVTVKQCKVHIREIVEGKVRLCTRLSLRRLHITRQGYMWRIRSHSKPFTYIACIRTTFLSL